MIVVGIDSASKCGVAVVEREPRGRERLVRAYTRLIRCADDVSAVVADLLPLAPDLVAIEAAYVAANVATSLALATLVGRWLQEWERRGVATVTFMANTWQIGLLSGLINHRSQRAARKAAARRWARATYGVELGEDAADASGIATWALRQAWLNRRAA